MTALPNREEIGRRVREQLGPASTEEMVSSVMNRVMALLPTIETGASSDTNQVLIVAYGRNRAGTLAAITGLLADRQCDILDISQTIREGQFALHLVVDMTAGNLAVGELQAALDQLASERDIRIAALPANTVEPPP